MEYVVTTEGAVNSSHVEMAFVQVIQPLAEAGWEISVIPIEDDDGMLTKYAVEIEKLAADEIYSIQSAIQMEIIDALRRCGAKNPSVSEDGGGGKIRRTVRS